MKVGSLFSGIGGFDLGLERAGMEIIWQVEIDPFCNKVLAKHWPKVKRFKDVKTVSSKELEPVDLICGGFPCQPFSCAGKRKGKEDDRALWPEMFRVVSEAKPRWIIGENVAGFIDMGLDDCISDLENQGYEVQTFIIPACAVNAPHRRDRVWIVANRGQQRERGTEKGFSHRQQPSQAQRKWANQGNGFTDEDRIASHALDSSNTTGRKEISEKNGVSGISGTTLDTRMFARTDCHAPDTELKRPIQRESEERTRSEEGIFEGCDCLIADTKGQGLEGRNSERSGRSGGWDTEHIISISRGNESRSWAEPWLEVATRLCRVDDGLPRQVDRVNRLKALGNAIVPQVVEIIGRAIMETEQQL